MTKNTILRITTAAFGAAVLVAAGSAMASAEEYGSDDVDITVGITQLEEPGVLAMSVAPGGVALHEDGSDALTRQFVGTLPTVTVIDTRSPDEIPEGALWYVLGTASDFLGSAGQPAITAEHLGWEPRLVDYDGDGAVFAGEPVDGEEDGGDGLADAELLASTFDSAGASVEGSWTATADLVLKTDADVAPGDYASTLTLSLFE